MTADYTPSTEEIRTTWVANSLNTEGWARWLVAHDAEVSRQAKAEALREAIDKDSRRIPDVLGYMVHVVFVEDLDERADRIAAGGEQT